MYSVQCILVYSVQCILANFRATQAAGVVTIKVNLPSYDQITHSTHSFSEFLHQF